MWKMNNGHFQVIDVIEILTDSSIPKRYWSDLKKKLQSEGSEVYKKIVLLKMYAPDGLYKIWLMHFSINY